MNRMRLSSEDIRAMNLFESLAGTEALDCLFHEGTVYFLVGEHKAALAIGKNGRNVKNLYKILNKKISILEYSGNIEIFLKNLLNGKVSKVETSRENEKKVLKIFSEKNQKGRLLGKGKRNLKVIELLVKRHFDIDEVRVI
jgi:NusA-like KH domain protein